MRTLTTRRDPVFPVNRGLRRSNRAFSRVKRCHRRQGPRQHLTRYYSQVVRHHIDILIVMINRQEDMGRLQAGRRQDLCLDITLKEVHIEIQLLHEDMADLLTALEPLVAPSNPQEHTDPRDHTLKGIHRHQGLQERLTRAHRSRHIRDTKGAGHLNLLPNRLALLAQVQEGKAPQARFHLTKIHSIRRTCLRTGRNRHYNIRVIRHRQGLHSRPRQTPMILTQI